MTTMQAALLTSYGAAAGNVGPVDSRSPAGRLDLGHVTTYPLTDAERAATDLRAGRIRGRAVLCP